MRVFFDTSTLVKKYIDEPGSVELDELMEKVSQVVVSSIYEIEIFSFINRKIREKEISPSDIDEVKKEVRVDYDLFETVIFSSVVRQKAIDLLEQCPLASLDSIQLASACIAQADMFVTSDKQLFKYASRELKKVQLI